MDKINHQLSALTCELEQLQQQLGSSMNHVQEEEEWEIQQRIVEIQHQIRSVIDQELDV